MTTVAPSIYLSLGIDRLNRDVLFLGIKTSSKAEAIAEAVSIAEDEGMPVLVEAFSLDNPQDARWDMEAWLVKNDYSVDDAKKHVRELAEGLKKRIEEMEGE